MSKTFGPMRPPLSIERAYYKKLRELIKRMDEDILRRITAAYKKDEAQIMDAPLNNIYKVMRSVIDEWTRIFNKDAEEIASWFTDEEWGFVAHKLAMQFKQLQQFGLSFTVNFRHRSEREALIFEAANRENVNLIKSIAEEHLSKVEGAVLRSIRNGQDLGGLTSALYKEFGVTERRAAMIARDQTAKTTENLSRVRLLESGVTEAVWKHSSAGKTYRETHVEMDGQKYSLEEGCFDEAVGRNIFPGELVNCRCFMVPVIPSFGERQENKKRREAKSKEEHTTQTPKSQQAEKPEIKQEKTSPQEGLSEKGEEIIKALESAKVERIPFKKSEKAFSVNQIIKDIGGGDKTRGSCSSLAFCYAGRRANYDVFDFRGGKSWDWFSRKGNIRKIANLPGVVNYLEVAKNDIKAVESLVKLMEKGKEYYLATGSHAAIIRFTGDVVEYLELQSQTSNGWEKLTKNILRKRFGCKMRRKWEVRNLLIDIESLGKSKDFKRILEYLNTKQDKQLKGAGGREK